MMRTAIVLVLAGSFALGATAEKAAAQAADSRSATMSASVINGLSLLKDSDLSFGTVVQNTGQQTRTATSAGIGKLRLVGQQNRSVTVTLTAPGVLANGLNTMTYTPGAARNVTTDDPGAATPFTFVGLIATATWQLTNNMPGNNGQSWLYIYGTIDVGNQPAGTYTGTFLVSAVY